MDPPLDDCGYLDAAAGFLGMNVLEPGKPPRTYFRASFLEQALWAYGEDRALDRVRQGLTRDEVERIGLRCGELELSSDPGRADGSGYAGDKALALAAVEVLEGRGRSLSRVRRRPGAHRSS